MTDHPLRVALHNELHARPPETMEAPWSLSHVVMLLGAEQRVATRDHLAQLLRDSHQPPPDGSSIHLRCDLGAFRLRWELHTEFASWTFSRQGEPGDLDGASPATALERVPRQWLAALPGQRLHGLHLWALPPGGTGEPACVKRLLQEPRLVGSSVAGGGARAWTDFALHADGFARVLLDSDGLSPRERGRLVQQLLELDTYRMAALLGLPAAREAASLLAQAEGELSALSQAIRHAERNDEPRLLDRLTRLAGQVEGHYAATHSRFSASAAYFELVDRRVADIGEQRLPDLQPLGQFISRRLAPARATCASSALRQDALSQRVSRMSSLLRTRVEIEQQQSSQALLAAMNTRQGVQLRLQTTVEGLSVAAITYYIVGLVSYLAKGAQALGWPFSAETTAACAIPVVALGVWWSLRRLHHRLLRHHAGDAPVPAAPPGATT